MMQGEDLREDIRIELEPVEVSPSRVTPRPDPDSRASMLVGRAPRSGPHVYLNVGAIETMFTDVSSHGTDETGGILSGDEFLDTQGAYVLVDAAIAAQEALRSATRVTFTHRGWTMMLAERQARFPEQSVIGWYHSHPGMPVLLSDTDRFVHGAFFNRPQDVAVVIDLQRREWAVFGWGAGELILLEGFWIYAEKAEDGAGLAAILERFAPRTA